MCIRDSHKSFQPPPLSSSASASSTSFVPPPSCICRGPGQAAEGDETAPLGDGRAGGGGDQAYLRPLPKAARGLRGAAPGACPRLRGRHVAHAGQSQTNRIKYSYDFVLRVLLCR
eukprot:3809131-Pyramimonas_sp.AAC.1